jgi:hypothetical protein
MKRVGQVFLPWIGLLTVVFAYWISDHDRLVALQRDVLACQRLLGLTIQTLERLDAKVDELIRRE